MLGAIAGDIVGSPYEGRSAPPPGFPLFPSAAQFTDDTVCTVAIADALTTGAGFARSLRDYALRYPDAGYGPMFLAWAKSKSLKPYGSYGNGSAMRVSPVAYVAKTAEEVLELARRSAEVTHNHPHGIAGAQAVALAIWLARAGQGKAAIRHAIETRFGYDLSPLDQHPPSGFDASCRGTVPPALAAALHASSWEAAIRAVIARGGDTDTLACICGGLAEALYGLPAPIARKALTRLDGPLKTRVQAFLTEHA